MYYVKHSTGFLVASRYDNLNHTFTKILSKASSYSTKEEAAEKLADTIKAAEERMVWVDKAEKLLFNPTPEQLDQFREVYHNELMRQSKYAAIPYDKDAMAKYPEILAFQEIWRESIFPGLNQYYWDEETNWFKKNYIVWENIRSIKNLYAKLKKCKIYIPQANDKIHFRNIQRKPTIIKCKENTFCSACGANVVDLPYLNVCHLKKSDSVQICAMCLARLAETMTDAIRNIDPEIIQAHAKEHFIRSI
jgi:hypothetical protein